MQGTRPESAPVPVIYPWRGCETGIRPGPGHLPVAWVLSADMAVAAASWGRKGDFKTPP